MDKAVGIPRIVAWADPAKHTIRWTNANADALPKSSYDSIRKHYVPYFEKDLRRLGAAIENPPTWSALKNAGERAIPADVAPDDDPTDDE
ncbi:hypothetical protein [Sorangium cellulosum]|uniref:hypothetical protein n=1 Tax=Sorangium cellulosum TaxID=56 RepID=UPI000405037A|nr:hypothetical protein [Sorangium cellulosum]